MGLFDEQFEEERLRQAPLARRMSPRTLEDYVGQEHILGKGKLLRKAIEVDKLTSAIFHGPPGSGKTALARIIALRTESAFERLNAVTSGVADLRALIEQARQRKMSTGRKTIVFIDEIHRFNRAQQDALLPDVEEGTITLISSTTQNPYFSVNSPLISRSQTFQFEPLSEADIEVILRRALADEEHGLGKEDTDVDDAALNHLARYADGDARAALNGLELAALTTVPDGRGVIHITLQVVEEAIQRKSVVYDGTGDDHYDTISAFIKSMRGSDPDSALYWMAKMLNAGEDPRFIARRIVICAAEDVGNADPQALVVANSALQVSEFIGMPEAQIPLAQAVTYIATAPKSNASCQAISRALKDVKERRTTPVPIHLRDSNYPGAKKLGHGKGYKYPHSYPGHFVAQDYGVHDRRYYEPTGSGYEAEIKKRLEKWRQQRQQEEKGQ